MNGITVDTSLSLQKVFKAAVAVLKSDLTPFLHSTPGIGKTSILGNVPMTLPDQFDKVITLDAAILADSTVLGGIPIPNREKGVTEWMPPDFFVNQLTSKTLLFLDDIPTLPISSTAPLLRMVQMRQIGSITLPNGVRFACAGNRAEDGAGAQKMSTALNNRCVHFNVIADSNEVVQHGMANNWNIATCMYLRGFGDAVSEFDKKEKAFPSPRSWEAVSKICNTLDAQTGSRRLSDDERKELKPLEMALFCGAVGLKRGVEFQAFRDTFMHVISPDAIYMSPATIPLPPTNKPDVLFATIGALIRTASEDRLEAFMTFVKRLPAAFTVSAVKDLIDVWRAKGKDFSQTVAMVKFYTDPRYMTLLN